jgi:CBS domain-containing protein
MQVKEVMTRGVQCVSPEDTLQDAATRMQQLDVGPLPVCENDQLVGMITDRDITIRCTAKGVNPWAGHVRDAMTPELFFCFDDQDVRDAAHEMQEHQVRRLVVLDHDKRMVGIVSLGDLAVDTHDEQLSGSTLEAISQPPELDGNGIQNLSD